MAGTVESPIRVERLVSRILNSTARVIALIAPAGFGKTSLALALGRAVGAHDVVPATADDLVRALEEHADGDYLAILDDVDAIPESHIAAIASAIELAPPSSRIVLCSRRKTGLHRGLLIAPNERLALDARDLAFLPAESLTVFDDAPIDPDEVSALIDLSEGWPVALLSMRLDHQRNALDDYLMTQVVDTLNDDERSALLLCSAMPGLRRRQIVAALPKPSAAFALVDLQLAAYDRNGGIAVRPILQHAIYRHCRAEMDEAVLLAAERFKERSDSLYAAAAYLHTGNLPAASEVLSEYLQRPKHLIGFPYHAISNNTRRGIDSASLKAYPILWAALFLERQFEDPPDALLQDAIEISEVLPPEDAALRNTILAMGALLARHAGKSDLASELLQRGLNGCVGGDDLLLLRSVQAMLQTHLGKARQASIAWLSVRPHFWGYHAWCAYMMLIEVKAARRAADSPGAIGTAERMLQTAFRSGSCSLVGYAAGMAALTALLLGDDARFEAYRKQLTILLKTAPSLRLQAIADMLDGRESDETRRYPVYDAWAKLIAAMSAAGERAPALARHAMQIADQCQDGALRFISRAILGRIDRSLQDALQRDCAAITDDDEVLTALYLRCAAFLQRYERMPGVVERQSPSVFIEVASGRVLRAGKPVDVSMKTQELLIALAVTGAALSRERLCDMLWRDESLEDACGALKMCVHRARQQLSYADAILAQQRSYALGNDVQSDAKALFRDDPPAHKRRDIFEMLTAGRPCHFSRWPWFEPYERHLVAKASDLGNLLASKALAEGDLEGALYFASVLTRLDPCDERATEVAIRAHLQRGERNLALGYYRQVLRSLKRELGVEPSDRLRGLLASPLQ